MATVRSKNWTGQDARFAHVKRDGHFLCVRKARTGLVSCHTRHPHDVTDKLRDRGWYLNVFRRAPAGTTILGELWYPGKPASYVKTAMKEHDPRLRFGAFALETAPADASLLEIESLCVLWGVEFLPFWITAGAYTPQSIVDMLTRTPQENVEGVVFKDGNLLNWRKWKPVKTMDLVIAGYHPGRGKYYGGVGALRCVTSEGREVARVSGMDEPTRDWVGEHREECLGLVVEVAYQYVGAGGRLRHPRFVGFRDDKQPEECTSDQDLDLEEHYR